MLKNLYLNTTLKVLTIISLLRPITVPEKKNDIHKPMERYQNIPTRLLGKDSFDFLPRYL
jgi:hypothetical protein